MRTSVALAQKGADDGHDRGWLRRFGALGPSAGSSGRDRESRWEPRSRVVSAVKIGQAAHARSRLASARSIPGDAEDLAREPRRGGAGSPTRRVQVQMVEGHGDPADVIVVATPRSTTLGSSSSERTESTSPSVWSRAPSRRRSPAGALRRAHRPVARWRSSPANGVDLWVEQEGEGQDVLFISGLADEGACWVDQVAGLRRPLPRHDLRQPGRRPVGDAGRAVRDRRLRSRHDRAHGRSSGSSAPHVVGSSMGGAIAQELALAHPERVRSLVLNGTWCRGDRFLHEVFRNWIWAAQKADSIRDFLRRRQPLVLRAANLERRHDGRLARRGRGEPASAGGRRVLPLGRGADRPRHADRLGATCGRPTLVTVGELDLVLPERFSQEIVEPDHRARGSR